MRLQAVTITVGVLSICWKMAMAYIKGGYEKCVAFTRRKYQKRR